MINDILFSFDCHSVKFTINMKVFYDLLKLPIWAKRQYMPFNQNLSNLQRILFVKFDASVKPFGNINYTFKTFDTYYKLKISTLFGYYSYLVIDILAIHCRELFRVKPKCLLKLICRNMFFFVICFLIIGFMYWIHK